MTVYLTGYKREYIGLAADAKPTYVGASTGELIPVGSVFRELDTSVIYIWDGTTWYGTYMVGSSSM